MLKFNLARKLDFNERLKKFQMIKYTISSILLVALAFGFEMNSSAQEPTDTIYKIEGKTLPVNIVKVTENYVSFLVQGNTETFTMERKDVQKIIYKSGRIDEFNKPIFKMISDYSWEAVWLTEDKKDVAELYKRGEISAKSPASARSPKAAKNSAIIRLQKKAAAIKGTVVYLTKKQATGGYGEYPGYYIEGVVYGTEPLSEGETEVRDKDTPIDGAGL
jgi:hypothetical protein